MLMEIPLIKETFLDKQMFDEQLSQVIVDETITAIVLVMFKK